MFWGVDNEDFNQWEGTFYDFFFSHFLNYHAFKDERECALYLNQLRPYSKELWQSYQNDINSIFPDYSNTLTQEAYFLRYCPLYSDSLVKILENLNNSMELPITENSNICIVSAGPASELRGILDFSKTIKISSFKNMKFSLVDKMDWKSTRTIIKQALYDYLDEDNVPEIKEVTIDILSDPIAIDADYDLIFFQNCINEYLSQKPNNEVMNRISKIIEKLTPQGLAIFSERASYKGMNLFFNELSETENANIIELIQGKIPKYRSIKHVPNILKTEFFKNESGLIASYNNSLEYIVFEKKYNKGFSFIPDKKDFISEKLEKVGKKSLEKESFYEGFNLSNLGANKDFGSKLNDGTDDLIDGPLSDDWDSADWEDYMSGPDDDFFENND